LAPRSGGARCGIGWAKDEAASRVDRLEVSAAGDDQAPPTRYGGVVVADVGSQPEQLRKHGSWPLQNIIGLAGDVGRSIFTAISRGATRLEAATRRPAR
jgi:hypothetical protein